MRNLKTYLILFISAIIIQSLLWPLLITNDGTTYISSAYNLFSESELTHYYWIRDPVYPIFLRLLNLNTALGIFTLKAFQTLFIYLSVFIIFEIAARYFKIEIKPIHLVTLFVLITLIFNYSVYSSIVLQQAMLTFIGALYTLLIFLILRARTLRQIYLVITLFLLLNLFSVNLIVFYKYIPVFLAPIFARSFARLRFQGEYVKKYITFLILAVFLAITPFLFSQPWLIYKEAALSPPQQTELTKTQPQNGKSSYPSPAQPIPTDLNNDISVVPENFRTTQFPDPITVFNNYRKEIRSNIFEFFQFREDPDIRNENSFFVSIMNDNRNDCIFIISSQWYPFYEFTKNSISEDCLIYPIKKQSLSLIISEIAPFNSFIYSNLSKIFILLFVTLLFVGKLNFVIYFLYPIIFATAYILSANTLDRYTTPLFPFYLTFAFIFLILMEKWIKRLLIRYVDSVS